MSCVATNSGPVGKVQRGEGLIRAGAVVYARKRQPILATSAVLRCQQQGELRAADDVLHSDDCSYGCGVALCFCDYTRPQQREWWPKERR